MPPEPPAKYEMPPANTRWTKVEISDSEYGSVAIVVHRIDMSLDDMVEDLIIPAMKAKGYGGVEDYIFQHEDT